MQIRHLVSGDAAEYRDLRLRACREHSESFTSSYEEEVSKPLAYSEQCLASTSSSCYWGTFVDGVLAGTVGLDREQRLKNRHKATVVGMKNVATELAGRGLLQAVLDRAHLDQLESLVLTVSESNTSAIDLYQHIGFVIFGSEPNAIQVDGRPYEKIHMYLDLTPSH